MEEGLPDLIHESPYVEADFHCSTLDSVAKCRYGKKGDWLWVRETHYVWGHWEKTDKKTPMGRPKWKFVPVPSDLSVEVLYEHNKPSSYRTSMFKEDPGANFWYKRLARFMPKKYARIWLEVTDIRVEALHDITTESAIAEGIQELLQSRMQKATNGRLFRDYLLEPELFMDGVSAKKSFESLFTLIHGEDMWKCNPWVWVIAFKLLSVKGKPNECKAA
jgi:hypothetical protein